VYVQAPVPAWPSVQSISTEPSLGTVTVRVALVYPTFVAVTVYVPRLRASR
jgi:hypothetical protein